METGSEEEAKKGETELKVKCLICEEQVKVAKLQSHLLKEHIGVRFGRDYKCNLCDFSASTYEEVVKHAMDLNHLPVDIAKKEKSVYVSRLIRNIFNDCLTAARKKKIISKEVPTSIKTEFASTPIVTTSTPTSSKKKPFVPPKEQSSSSSSSDSESDKEESSRKRKEPSHSPAEEPPIEDHGAGKKICKLCVGKRVAIPKGTVNFYRHVSKYHMNIAFTCPFCKRRKRNAEALENHVKERHPDEEFSILNIKEKVLLMKKSKECFPSPNYVPQAKKKKSLETNAAQLPKEKKVSAANTSGKDSSDTSSNLSMGLPGVVSATTMNPILAAPTIICAKCNKEVGNTEAERAAHVSRDHLTDAERSGGNPTTTASGFYEIRHCFPEILPNCCALCNKVLASETGKRSHAATHAQEPLQCPMCPRTECVLPRLSRHIKVEHAREVPEDYRFVPSQEYTIKMKTTYEEAFPNRNVSAQAKHASVLPQLVLANEQGSNVANVFSSLHENLEEISSAESQAGQKEFGAIQAQKENVLDFDEIHLGISQPMDFEQHIPNQPSPPKECDDDDIQILPSSFRKEPTRPEVKVPENQTNSRSSNEAGKTLWGAASAGLKPKTTVAVGTSGSPIVLPAVVQCKGCLEMIPSQIQEMVPHIWKKHIKVSQPPLLCLRCSFRGYTPDEFRAHYRSAHGCYVGLPFEQMYHNNPDGPDSKALLYELARCFNVGV